MFFFLFCIKSFLKKVLFFVLKDIILYVNRNYFFSSVIDGIYHKAEQLLVSIIADLVASFIEDIMMRIINCILCSFMAGMLIGMIYDDTNSASASYPSCLVSTLVAVSPAGPRCGGPLSELRLQRGTASHRLLRPHPSSLGRGVGTVRRPLIVITWSPFQAPTRFNHCWTSRFSQVPSHP